MRRHWALRRSSWHAQPDAGACVSGEVDEGVIVSVLGFGEAAEVSHARDDSAKGAQRCRQPEQRPQIPLIAADMMIDAGGGWRWGLPGQ